MGCETVNHCNEGFSWILSDVTGIVNNDTHKHIETLTHILSLTRPFHSHIHTNRHTQMQVQTNNYLYK